MCGSSPQIKVTLDDFEMKRKIRLIIIQLYILNCIHVYNINTHVGRFCLTQSFANGCWLQSYISKPGSTHKGST